MSNFDSVDIFTDESLLEDPYPYYEYLRAKCPVVPTAHYNMVAVTGYDEASEIYRDIETFSSCNTVAGPFFTFPEPLESEDVTDIIERYRDQIPMNEHMVTMDPPRHTQERALLVRLLTPKRLKENEAFMERLADQQLDGIIGEGRCEFIMQYGQPFAMLTIADVLGVPEVDHPMFRQGFGLLPANPGQLGGVQGDYQLNTMAWLDDVFTKYIEDRRREPRHDVLTDLALGKYPDGSTPPVTAVVRTATFLFSAGQGTTAHLMGTALKYLAEDLGLQDDLRAHPDRIPNFIEEALRIESPVKIDPRLTKRATTVAGVHIAPGTPLMMLHGGVNRDPRRFERPDEFQADRPNAKEHLAFGRGPHSCPGGPLARAEGRISIERILSRMRNIRLSEEHHGPPSARHFDYEPAWVMRGLHELHLEFDPS
jgi:cytochrome P450